MPSLSVLVHIRPGDSHLERLLETLRPADETVLVDHTRDERVQKVAREYGARLVAPVPGVDLGAYALNCANDWILCLLPSESLSEALEAALFEWKRSEPGESMALSMPIREQTDGQWQSLAPETRLVDRRKVNWQGALPPTMAEAQELNGHVLRIGAGD